MQVFAKRVFKFDPMAKPIVAFRIEENRAALIEASQPGDVIILVGTTGEPTLEEDRGRLLGMAEFSPIPIDASSILDPAARDYFELGRDGTPNWPKALPIVRAWAFEPKLKLIDVLKEQLTFEATVRAVRLEEDDANTVLALPKVEVRLPRIPFLERLRAMTDALQASQPTTGPVPNAWTGIVTKTAAQEAWTYVMRFGRRNVWKIGHTQDLACRLAEINQHVPHEELGERWAIVMHQHWESSFEAYEMEQCVLGALGPFRTEGERIRCSEVELQIAWTQYLSD
jgi:hypothetical protein